MAGYVYCFTNPLMINLCKCGGTKNQPEIRCNQLFTTALPVPCNVEFYIKVKDWRKAEKEIHNKIKEIGIKRFENREWFYCQPKDIKNIYDNYHDKTELTNSTIIHSENSTITNKYDNIIINKKYKDSINYYCNYCDYMTNDSGNFSHHKISKKHLAQINQLKITEYDKIIQENSELKQKLADKKKEMEQKLLEKLEEINKILKKQADITNNTQNNTQNNNFNISALNYVNQNFTDTLPLENIAPIIR
jgi:hypothetical protein